MSALTTILLLLFEITVFIISIIYGIVIFLLIKYRNDKTRKIDGSFFTICIVLGIEDLICLLARVFYLKISVWFPQCLAYLLEKQVYEVHTEIRCYIFYILFTLLYNCENFSFTQFPPTFYTIALIWRMTWACLCWPLNRWTAIARPFAYKQACKFCINLKTLIFSKLILQI